MDAFAQNTYKHASRRGDFFPHWHRGGEQRARRLSDDRLAKGERLFLTCAGCVLTFDWASGGVADTGHCAAAEGAKRRGRALRPRRGDAYLSALRGSGARARLLKRSRRGTSVRRQLCGVFVVRRSAAARRSVPAAPTSKLGTKRCGDHLFRSVLTDEFFRLSRCLMQ